MNSLRRKKRKTGIESSFVGFLNNQKLSIFIEKIKQENPEEIMALLDRANQFIDGNYVFQNEWDMERTSEVEQLPLEILTWDYNPKGDPEWTYMLNRQAYLIDVAVAYLVTKNDKTKEYIKSIILSFVKNCPLNERNQSTGWRTIDAGLRLVNWVRVFEMIPVDDLFEVPEKELVYRSIQEHLIYLDNHLEICRGQSNWIVIEICGLLIGGLAFSNYFEMEDTIIRSLNFLREALELQVEGDFLQREQSFMYHHEVLLCILMIKLILERNDRSVPEWLKKIAMNMAQASARLIDNNGNQIAYGDSDIEPMINLLETAEIILNHPLLIEKHVTKESYLFTKLLVGSQSKPVFAREKKLKSYYFENSGITVLRNQVNNSYTLFKCGPLGGGHGHDDLLHFELHSQNEAILVDSGRYSYETQKHNRLLFKEAFAHNTITIEQKNFNEHTDAWNSLRVATPINQKYKSKNNYHFVEGGHLGYFNDYQTLINRKLLYLEEGIWLIFDEVFTQKSIQVTSHFHFVKPQITKISTGYVYTGENQNFLLETFDNSGEFILEEFDISPQYNQKYRSQKLRYVREIDGNHVQTFLLKNQNYKGKIEKIPVFVEGIKMPSEIVEGFRITQVNDEFKYLIVQHQEPNIGRRAYQIDGFYVYGKVVIANFSSERKLISRIILD